MKNLLIFICLLVVASCSNSENLSDAKQIELLKAELQVKSSVGRFQYVPQSNGYINRGKLIDTATGRIWQDTCFRPGKGSECLASAWSEEDIIGITIESAAYHDYLERAYPRKPASQNGN